MTVIEEMKSGNSVQVNKIPFRSMTFDTVVFNCVINVCFSGRQCL